MTEPAIPYWHVWCDADGISHQRRASLGSFALNAVSEGSAQIWQRDGGSPTKVLFLTLLPGDDSSWDANGSTASVGIVPAQWDPSPPH